MGLVAELPNLIVLRTLSKAFGLAGLRVGYAVAAPELAAELDRRRPPASVSAPAARIAAAALREPRLEVEQTIAERERVRAALAAAGYDCPEAHGNFVWLRTDEPLGERLESAGLVVRVFDEGIRISLRRPPDNDVLLEALEATAGPPPGRMALVTRTSTETALRLVLDLDGAGRARVTTGIGFLDHLLTLLAFHGELRPRAARRGDLEVDEHHTVEDVLAALGDALGVALGDRAGVARYGSASVPMDEALATAAVDLVRRPHAEIELAFAGDRIGGLAPSLLPHALERFAMQSGSRSTSPPPAATIPRRRGRVQGARPGARGSVRTRSRRRALDEGTRVKVALADYGAGNLRSVCAALERAGASPRSPPIRRRCATRSSS